GGCDLLAQPVAGAQILIDPDLHVISCRGAEAFPSGSEPRRPPTSQAPANLRPSHGNAPSADHRLEPEVGRASASTDVNDQRQRGHSASAAFYEKNESGSRCTAEPTTTQ